MAHAKAGMAPLFDVVLRSAKAVDEEIAQAFFGSGHVAALVHGAENGVVGDLPVKGGDQEREAGVATNGRINFVFFHEDDASNSSAMARPKR